MAVIELWFRQDIRKHVQVRTLEQVFSQDALGNVIGVEVFDKDTPVMLTGTAVGYCILQDGTTVPIAGTISENRAQIALPSSAYSIPGRIFITIKNVNGNVITTLLAVGGTVVRSRTGVEIDPGSAVEDWASMISEKIQEMDDYILVQSTQPESETNKVWFDSDTSNEVLVPTLAEYKRTLDAIESIPPSIVRDNLLIGYADVSRTSNKVSIAGNPMDGITIATNSSASANASLRLLGDNSTIHLKGGKTYLYTATHSVDGQPEMGATTWQLTLRRASSLSSDSHRTLHKDGVLFSVEEDTDFVPFIRVMSGVSLNDTIFPVLCEYSAPIAEEMDNRLGGKATNLYNKAFFAASATALSGVTLTNNHDGTYTLNGQNLSGDVGTIAVSNTYGILLEAGKTYAFASNNNKGVVPSDSTYRLLIRKVSAAGTNVASEYPIGGTFIPDETTLYRFLLRVNTDYSFDNVVIRPTLYDITGSKSGIDNSSVFKVCAFNVGNFSMGQSGTAAGNNQIYRGLVNAFSRCNANVYLFSEWDKYWNGTTLSEDVFSRFKPYHSHWIWNNVASYVAQMIYSDYDFVMERHFFLNDGHSRHLVDDVIPINGRLVHFISVHMNAPDLQSRYDNYDKIFAYLQSNGYDTYVIAGDFNHGYGGTADLLTTARQEINYIENLGGVSVQGGFYGSLDSDGFINTYISGNDIDDVRPYENIIVSPNIRIKNVFKAESAGTESDPRGSDHYPLCAELEIID